MNNNRLIKDIIISQKDFDLLPRDKDGYCYYDGDLIISDCNIKKLPSNLVIGCSLDCSSNELKELPKGLVVTSYLWCNDNQLKELPSDLVVKYSLSCNHNELTTLPNGLKLDGDLWCNHNQIKKLPDDLNIEGVLYCYDNRITKEIKSKIGGEIVMDDEQQMNYDRAIKINKLKENIHG